MLRPVAPVVLPGQGSVVGGAERFARSDLDTLRPVAQAEPAPHLALVARAGLTARDVTVLGFLAQGWTTAEIAQKLVYAESTIKKEVHLIVHRLGARNRTHAVALAVRGAVI